MTKPKNSLIKQYKFMFGIDDVEFHMTEGAMQAVAETAIKKDTGARGLRSIMESLLLEVCDRIFSLRSREGAFSWYTCFFRRSDSGR